MADVINTLVDFIGQVSPILIYLLLFFIAYMENIVPPVPGDVIVAFGGYLISLAVSYTHLTLPTTPYV